MRVKDSTCIITGECIEKAMVGIDFLGKDVKREDVTFKIENNNGRFRNVFKDMNDFALSLNKPLEYSISK